MTKIAHVRKVPFTRVPGLDQAGQQALQRNFEGLHPQLVPTGVTLPWGGQDGLDVPRGWLLCDGTAYNTGDYQNLFNVIGYTFGGSGSTFNVPNMSDRFPRGTHLGSEVGDIGGSADSLAAHSHTVNNHGHGFVAEAPGTNIQSADHAHHTTTGGVSANHVHVPGGCHSHSVNAVVFSSNNATHAHNGGCGQVAESPGTGAVTGWGCTGSTSCNSDANTAGVSSDHVHSGWSGGINTNHSHTVNNHGHGFVAEAPGTNSQGTAGGNLPPFMDFRFIIKT